MARDKDVDQATAARRRKRNKVLAIDGTRTSFGAFEFSDIGDAFSDAASAVGDAVDTATGAVSDVFTSAVDDIPGGRDVRLALDSVLTGAVRDFANTTVGHVILVALATAMPEMVGVIAPVMVGIAGLVSVAIPQLLAGDPSFSHAWALEFGKRCKQTAEYFGGDAAGDILDKAFASLSDYVVKNGVDLTQWTRDTFQDLAQKADVPDVVAAYAVGLAHQQLPSSWIEWSFDPKTGKASRKFALSTVATTTAQLKDKLATILAPKKAPAQTSARLTSSSVQAIRSVIGPAPAATPAPVPSAVRSVSPEVQVVKNNISLLAGLGVVIAGSLVLLARKKRS